MTFSVVVPGQRVVNPREERKNELRAGAFQGRNVTQEHPIAVPGQQGVRITLPAHENVKREKKEEPTSIFNSRVVNQHPQVVVVPGTNLSDSVVRKNSFLPDKEISEKEFPKNELPKKVFVPGKNPTASVVYPIDNAVHGERGNSRTVVVPGNNLNIFNLFFRSETPVHARTESSAQPKIRSSGYRSPANAFGRFFVLCSIIVMFALVILGPKR